MNSKDKTLLEIGEYRASAVSIIDYGMGNIGSIINMFNFIGVDCCVITTNKQIRSARSIILPGVGQFDHAMKRLNEMELVVAIKDIANQNRVPILGICLGMQILCRGSEEGNLPGLGLIDADVKRIKVEDGSRLKVPHMGWDRVDILMNDSPLGARVTPKPKYYFAHSYCVHCDSVDNILAVTNYGGEIVSAIRKNKIIGVQFHPEKSHGNGLELFQRFAQSIK
jgi:glutamine amidotransferase